MCALLGLNSFGRIFPKMKIGVKLFQILPNRESVKSQNDFFLPYTHTYTQHIRRKNLWLRNVWYLLKPKIIGFFFVTKNFSLKKKISAQRISQYAYSVCSTQFQKARTFSPLFPLLFASLLCPGLQTLQTWRHLISNSIVEEFREKSFPQTWKEPCSYFPLCSNS